MDAADVNAVFVAQLVDLVEVAVAEGFLIALQEHLGVESPFQPARKAHPALRVADLAAAEAHLATHGVPFARDASVEGMVRGYLHDPFGNRLELIEDAS